MSYGFLNKQGAASAGSSTSETPILCETCLGPNPYVRMSKQHLGKECKICGRPFTVFRWNPGAGMRFKKTEICTTCAKIKHVCQTCILDLDYGLPTNVRDAALGVETSIPMNDVNRQYFVNRMDALMDGDTHTPTHDGAGHALLRRLARDEPDYKRNRPQVCSFYARGACTRGEACPYRHEIREEQGRQSIQERYHGAHDVIGRGLLKKHAAARGLVAPSDPAIMTLFLTALPEDVTQDTLRTALLASVPSVKSDEIRSIQHVTSSNAAFLNFSVRQKGLR
ncbi:Slt11p [Malassezia vespertilionis]|uniref:Slt11p n=1 Tax=Malassezia vespertilionis TaxID=2020962 RepID=A0A2N1J7P5_9BASI|nr:Slt11p [Malassezia vespertilionis]